MRILLINSYYYPDIKGGAEVSVKKLAEQLKKNGHEVFVICSGEKDENIINGVNIIRIDFNKFKGKGILNKVMFKILSIKNFTQNKYLKKKIIDINPDIIHCNNIYNISTEIWSIANKLNVPIIQTLRDYFLICNKSTLVCKNKKGCNNIVCGSYLRYMRKNFKKVSFITAPSQATLNKFIERKMFKSEKSKVVYNAIDKAIYSNNEIIKIRLNKKEDKIKFCFLGALVEHKGIKKLINEFNLLEQSELNIAGSGYLENYIIESSKENKNIKFYGNLSESQVEKFLLENDVLIVPSLWEEPFGRVVIDAYKYGMPVIVSNLGGLPEIVDEGKTGFIFNAKNEQELGKYMRLLNSREKINSMVINCITKVDEYSLKRQVEEFEEIYKKIINQY